MLVRSSSIFSRPSVPIDERTARYRKSAVRSAVLIVPEDGGPVPLMTPEETGGSAR